MKKIIITPFDERYEFSYSELNDFSHTLTAVLMGNPKKVTVYVLEDDSCDQVFKVEYL